MKIAIFVQHHRVACFSSDATGAWARQRIKGESLIDIKPGKTALEPILAHLSDRFNQEHALRDMEIHLLYAQADSASAAGAPHSLMALHCTSWQILRLEPLLERAAVASGVTPAQPLEGDDKWLKTVLLPILTSTFAYSNKAFQVEEERARQAHEDTMESLRVEAQARRQEVAQLQARIHALQLPAREHLLVYLPAIYRNFWGVVRPDELALLAGTLTVPNIPSPYPDPSPDTVMALRRRLLQLPELDRERVLGFCRALPHRLDARPEMRDLLGEI